MYPRIRPGIQIHQRYSGEAGQIVEDHTQSRNSDKVAAICNPAARAMQSRRCEGSWCGKIQAIRGKHTFPVAGTIGAKAVS